MNTHVLLVDDDQDLCLLLAARLSQHGFHITWKPSSVEALAALEATPVDVVVTDASMAGMNGFELCERIVANHPDLPVMLLTAFGTLQAATTAIRVGACDFLTKPPDIEEFVGALDRAVRSRRLRGEVKRLMRANLPRIGEILTGSPAMQNLYEVLDRVAESDASVLITGESGTGKELLTRALHRGGRRAAEAFVAVDCAAVPDALLESELFGHVQGAFTDARRARTGLFKQADGGTLFLDEVGELPLSLQPKLLRALQERRVRPVGSDQEIPCDVRLVAATNRDLEAAVREGRFRHDLYFRINVVHLEIPPLRARGHDVLLLAQHFLDRCAAQAGKRVIGVSPQAAEYLLAYAWPGNVRELQNCIEHAVVFARYEEIVVDDLPEQVRRSPGARGLQGGDHLSPLVALEEVERLHVLHVLDAARGNRTLAAQMLEIDRKTLLRKLKRYAAQPEEAGAGAAPQPLPFC
jgi:two-component system response regulator HydG